VDRVRVALPPIYPAPAPGFLRLPETRSAPVAGAGSPAPAGALPRPPARPGDGPAWTPARLEPVVGIDRHGRVTSILEYTPGRFER
jgi:hypothetical protein